MGSPSLFDRLAARDWGSGLDDPRQAAAEGSGSGLSSLQSAALREYLPSVLRLLRDADNAQESAGSKELVPIVDKLMEVAMRYQSADAIEEYLCVASDVCKARLKGLSSSPIKGSTAAASSSSSSSATTGGAATTGKSDDPAGHKNTVLLFESGSAVTRTKLVLGELLEVLADMRQRRAEAAASGGAGVTGKDRGETADILNRTSFSSELECLLPVLAAYAPSLLCLRDVAKGLLLHSKLAPAFLQTLVQNEPLALSAVLRGLGEAVAELESLGSSGGRAAYVMEHAEQTCVRLAQLSRTVALEVRSALVSQRLLPHMCLRLSREPLGDVSGFLVGLWGGHEWFWDVVDVGAVLQALAGPEQQQQEEDSLTLDRAVALAVSSLDDRLAWHHLQPLWDKLQALPTSSDRSVLPLLLLLLQASYVEGLNDESHPATESFLAALVRRLQEGAATGWSNGQGCVPLHVALLLTAQSSRVSVLVDSLLTPLADSSALDGQPLKEVASACRAAGADGRYLELSQGWLLDQLSRLPPYPWPPAGARSDPLHCLVEAFEQGLGPLDVHDWLLGLLRVSPFPDALARHPCLLPLVDHYATACIDGTAPKPTVQWALPHELHQLATPPPALTRAGAVHPCSSSPFYCGTTTARRRRKRGWATAPAPGRELVGWLTGDGSEDEEEGGPSGDDDTTTGPWRWSVAAAMVSCVLALRLHELYLGSGLSFDMPFDYDLPALPLRLLLDMGAPYRALHLRLVRAAVALRPDLFQPTQLLQEADHHAAMQPWADGLPSPQPQLAVGLLPLDGQNGLEEEEAVLSALARLLQQHEHDEHLPQLAREVEVAWWQVWRRHPQRAAWEVRTLETLIAGGGHDPYIMGAGPGMLSRRAAAQEPLLALRTPPWALRHAPILRVTLAVLRSLLVSSRLEVACAWRGNVLRTELVNLARRDAEMPTGFEPPMLQRQASVISALPADGPAVTLLQEAIVVKCLLAHAAHRDTGLEARQECCLFLQGLLLDNPRLLPLLVHRGLKPLEVSVLLDGVPSALTLRSGLASLIRSSSLTSHARALCFLVEFARRYQSDEVFVACRQALGAVLAKISPTQLQVCVTEGEDVSTSMQAISQATLALVLLFPALRPHLVPTISKVTQAKDLDPLARQSSAYQEALGLLESLLTRIQGPLENLVP